MMPADPPVSVVKPQPFTRRWRRLPGPLSCCRAFALCAATEPCHSRALFTSTACSLRIWVKKSTCCRLNGLTTPCRKAYISAWI